MRRWGQRQLSFALGQPPIRHFLVSLRHSHDLLFIWVYDKTMYTVIETHEFITWSVGVWNDEERCAFVDFISQNPLSGDVIPGAGPLRKVRWSRAGVGKRSGARVIYFNRLINGDIVLLLVYAKAKFDNIRPEVLLKIKEKYDV